MKENIKNVNLRVGEFYLLDNNNGDWSVNVSSTTHVLFIKEKTHKIDGYEYKAKYLEPDGYFSSAKYFSGKIHKDTDIHKLNLSEVQNEVEKVLNQKINSIKRMINRVKTAKTIKEMGISV